MNLWLWILVVVYICIAIPIGLRAGRIIWYQLYRVDPNETSARGGYQPDRPEWAEDWVSFLIGLVFGAVWPLMILIPLTKLIHWNLRR